MLFRSEILNMTELVESFKARLEKDEIPNAPYFRKFFKKKKDKQKTDKPDGVKPKDLYEFDVQSWVTFTQTCGCFVLGSSEVKSAPEALNIYRQKDTVEKAFNNYAEDAESDAGNVPSKEKFLLLICRCACGSCLKEGSKEPATIR